MQTTSRLVTHTSILQQSRLGANALVKVLQESLDTRATNKFSMLHIALLGNFL
jgi:hypothetical protein